MLIVRLLSPCSDRTKPAVRPASDATHFLTSGDRGVTSSPVLVLAVDTATPAVTAGLVRVRPPEVSPVVPDQVVLDPRAHVEELMARVHAVLAEADVTLAEVNAVVCGRGPGPFTGLRVGMVTAVSLADALDIPVYAVSSLAAIAAVHDAPKLAVITDARRREVYSYLRTPELTVGPQVGTPADLRVRLDELAIPVVAGAGAELYASVFDRPLADGPRHPTAEGLVRTAMDLLTSGAPSSEITPLYLRKPDAVAPVFTGVVGR